MEKKKKSKRRKFLGLTIDELTPIVGVIAFTINGALYFERKFASIDQKFEGNDRRFEKVENDLTTSRVN